MLAVNFSTFRNKLKEYCDQASDNNETVIVTRKKDKTLVCISLDQYNQIMKAVRNAEYLAMIDRGLAQVENGTCQPHELAEVEDDE